MVFWYQQQLTDSLPQDIESIFEEEDGLPDISFRDYAIQKGFGSGIKLGHSYTSSRAKNEDFNTKLSLNLFDLVYTLKFKPK